MNKFLLRLDRKFGKYGIPNLTLYLIAGQVIIFLLTFSGRGDIFNLLLIPERVIAQGEWWRIFTFLFAPPASNPIFIFFAWYLFYLMGSALEEYWGTFHYNLFIFTGWFMTVAASFAVPYGIATNLFLGGSVFLAFAFLFPDFVINIFFVLPVRIKWLALLTWIGYGWRLLVGNWQDRLMVVASVANLLLFFGSDIFWFVKSGTKKVARQALREEKQAYHRCSVCGITDISHPDMDFRYCPECEGQYGYCRDHIFNHQHIKKSS